MIIYDARRIKAYEYLGTLCEYCGKDDEFKEGLWEELILDVELMGEFMYYLDNHSILDSMRFRGYSLTDLYFFNMRRAEVRQDIGKNYADSDKEAMVLDTFRLMAAFKKDPEKYLKKINDSLGMDM